MWYECLPSMVIITVALAVPSYAGWGINKLWQGNVSIIKRKVQCFEASIVGIIDVVT